MKKKQSRRKNNKGLTLIELIVTVAIIAIFSGIVLSIVTTSSNTFRATSSTAKVQMKTQELLDTIQDLVIDANRSVYYSVGAGEGNFGTEIKNDIDGNDMNSGDTTGVRTFYVCSADNMENGKEMRRYDVVKWDPMSRQVKYLHKEIEADKDSDTGNGDAGENPPAAFAAEESISVQGEDIAADDLGKDQSGDSPQEIYSVLAEDVSSFRADTTKVESEMVVRFRISMDVRGKEITTLHTVNLRNQIKVVPPDSAFQDAPSTPISVRITHLPERKELTAGTKWQLDAIVTGDVKPEKIWTVDENAEKNLGAKIDKNGILFVEKGGTVTVTVTVYSADGVSSDSDSVTLFIIEKAQLEELTISGPNTANALEGGNTVDLGQFKVTGKVGNDIVDYTDKVTWSCSGNDNVTLNGEQILISGSAWSSDGPAGSFVLTATSTEGKEASVEVKIAKIKITASKDIFESGDQKCVSVEYYVGADASSNYIVKLGTLNWLSPYDITEDILSEAAKYEYGKVSVTAAGSTGVTDSISIQIKDSFGLKVTGQTLVEVKNEIKNIEYTVKTVKNGVETPFEGQVIWETTGNPHVAVTGNGQVTIQKEAWNLPGGPGIFTLKAKVTDAYGDVIESNTLIVTLVRIRILSPVSGASYRQGVVIPVKSEFYVGNELKPHELFLDDTKFENTITAGTVGLHVIKASGTEGALTITDQVEFNVQDKLKYKIIGSDIMPDTVAKDKNYKYNETPLTWAGNQEVLSRAYWVESDDGEFVRAKTWDITDNGDTIVFTATFIDNLGKEVTLSKLVHVVSVIIEEPAGTQLQQGMSYPCTARLTFGDIGACTWNALSGGTYDNNKGILEVGTSPEVKLSVTTKVRMQNEKGHKWDYVIKDENEYVALNPADGEWMIVINKPTGSFWNPASIDFPSGNGTASTYLEAEVRKTNGDNEKGTQYATDFRWRLYVIGMGWISGSEDGEQIVDFPSGNGSEGAAGQLRITNYPLALPLYVGILYVDCTMNGQTISASKVVVCK